MSPRASTADLLRRTALQMFTEQGFDAVPVTAIAKAAGVSHMTFFLRSLSCDHWGRLWTWLNILLGPDSKNL